MRNKVEGDKGHRRRPLSSSSVRLGPPVIDTLWSVLELFSFYVGNDISFSLLIVSRISPTIWQFGIAAILDPSFYPT